MKLSNLYRSRVFLVASVGVLMLALAGGGVIQASNMGFKMNKQICSLAGYPKGQNLVSLPFRSPYTTASDLCLALGLTSAAVEPRGHVIQQQGGAGFKDFPCGGAAAGDYLLQKGPPGFGIGPMGVTITNPSQVSGILVGSHAGPPMAMPIYKFGAYPNGQNVVPIPYHTTAAFGRDICSQVPLGSNGTGVFNPSAQVSRINACTGQIQAFNCGGNPAGDFSLVLGEGLLTLDPLLLPVSAGPLLFVPPHF